MTTGPLNLITDVPGVLVGQAEDPAGITGTTVVFCEKPLANTLGEASRALGVSSSVLYSPSVRRWPSAISWRSTARHCTSLTSAPIPKVDRLWCRYCTTLSVALPRKTSIRWTAPKRWPPFWWKR